MNKICHSLLFVPAECKKMAKIECIKADAAIIDLEDAVLEADKERALQELQHFLDTCSYKKDIYVRVNPQRLERETAVLKGYPITGYMLPKTETQEELDRLYELAPDKKNIALLETLKGVMNIRQLVSHRTVHMAAFGAEDFTAQSGICKEEEYLAYVKGRIVLYAKAIGKPVFDTISLNITDAKEYRKEVRRTMNYGFDGKLAIHPMQTDVINEEYASLNMEQYRRIIDAYYKGNQAVAVLDGRIYEKPHIKRMEEELRKQEGNR